MSLHFERYSVAEQWWEQDEPGRHGCPQLTPSGHHSICQVNIRNESSCRECVNAGWDGRGLGWFLDTCRRRSRDERLGRSGLKVGTRTRTVRIATWNSDFVSPYLSISVFRCFHVLPRDQSQGSRLFQGGAMGGAGGGERVKAPSSG